MSTPLAIPHPPEKLLIGNVLDLGPSTQVQDMMKLAQEYGEIFYLQLGGRRLVVVSSQELVNELCDESRFDKRVWAPLQNVRGFAGDGLFTAHTFEPNWKKAHNILLPHFGQPAMKRYHDMMVDIAMQLVRRGELLNANDQIDVADTMTRLTLDTIGLCGFDYRFNSFHRESMHPFIRAMTKAMSIALDRSIRPEIASRLLFRQNARFRKAVARMNHTVDGIIQERRASGEDLSARGDLLSAMLSSRDPETGETLDDVNIRYQIITFLIAGHETTSGLLSFAAYFLLRHPDVLEKARAEVDEVFGRDHRQLPTYRQTVELRYVKQVLNESLRLWPTAPMFALFPKEGDTTLGGRYEVSKRDGLAVLAPMLHRDKKVWGPDPEAFDPDRFEPEREAALPPNAFKPFGNGQRACIGRQFAMHEAALALGLVLQRFELLDDPDYELQIKETLTLKPYGFKVKIRPREGATSVAVAEPPLTESQELALPAIAGAAGTPLRVLFGSNMGTSEGIAARIAQDAASLGFEVTTQPLDEAVGNLPTDGAVVIVCSSYNGSPPDNARAFVDWLGQDDAPQLAGVRYVVFGCGHRDWAATYQQVPTKIDQLLHRLGAERIFERGEGDGGDDFDGDFEFWYQLLWPSVAQALGLELPEDEGTAAATAYDVEVVDESHPNPFVVQFGARAMTVTENAELQTPLSDRSTRHLEVALPTGVTYRTGDHLGVISASSHELVGRVLARFGLDEQTRVKLDHPGSDTLLPLGQPIRLARLLEEYVELQAVATRKQIRLLLEHTQCPHTRSQLIPFCEDDEEAQERYRDQILERRVSLLDLLEEHPACELPLGAFLGLLGPLRPRYYSISSSPRKFERILSITAAVVEGPALSGRGTYRGTCSNYLARLGKGDTLYAFVRENTSGFRPPAPEAPLLMIGPGTGIAPFRGFLEDRDAAQAGGARLGEALLFFGCRHPDHDYLYRQELEDYKARGLCEVFVAFSRLEETKVYVQDRLLEQQERVWDLLQQGARVYVCGDASDMAPEVRATLVEICATHGGLGDTEAEEYVASLEASGRYLADVWSS